MHLPCYNIMLYSKVGKFCESTVVGVGYAPNCFFLAVLYVLIVTEAIVTIGLKVA